MALPYESIIASAPFRFLVGSNKRLFTVHGAAVTHHSKPLDNLVNGHMSEAKEGCATLEDVDESTFVRFSQYAYTGDYVAADPEILLDSSNIALEPSKPTPSIDTDEPVAFAVDEPSEHVSTTAQVYVEAELTVDEDQFWGVSSPRGKKTSKYREPTVRVEMASPSRKEKLWKNFKGRNYNPSAPPFLPPKKRESCEDYKDVFLCHARLYVFAEKYDIAPLRKLSLKKLHHVLSVFTPLYKERIADIVALMEYSYANTPQRSPTDDPLRSLVIHYAACVVEELVPDQEFKKLLAETDQLASDLVVKMIHRLD